MKNIVIVAKAVINGKRNEAFYKNIKGVGFNVFKRTKSEILQDNLNEAFEENNMNYNIAIDQSYGDIEELIRQDTDLFLISPYIKDYISIDKLDGDNYYMLSEQEFLEGDIEGIIEFL